MSVREPFSSNQYDMRLGQENTIDCDIKVLTRRNLDGKQVMYNRRGGPTPV